MASSASFPRKYYSVLYADLNTIPLVEGNVIATYDTDGFYYDVGNPAGSGQNVVRRQASSMEFVGDTLPESRHEPTTIFVVHTGDSTDENGNPISLYSGYKWNDAQEVLAFEEVFNNLQDFKVKSDVLSGDTKAYLVGSISNTADTGTLLKSSAYITSDGKINGYLEGTAKTAENAEHAERATNATYAAYDYEPDDISYTPKKINGYIRGLSSDATQNLGSTITFTKGDGTSDTIRVSDTTYSVFTSATAGLVNGTNVTVAQDTSGLILSGDGWISTSDITLPAAESATKDGAGNVITSTYYADADLTGHTFTLTKGDGTTSDVFNLPDTTYSVFTTDTNGLVPGPTAQQATMFLRGDAHWSALPVFAGSDPGLVPTAAAADAAKYLKGNGTWGTTFAQGTAGLVPGPSTADPTMSLKADGTWSADTDTKNTAGATNDTSKLFVIGAQAQSTNPQTYSNVNVYIDNGKLYQNSDNSATDEFTGDGSEDTFTLNTAGATAITEVLINNIELSSGFQLDTSDNTIVFDSAPTNGASISVTYSIPTEAVQVVDVQSNQTLSNKKFLINGSEYSVGTACGSNTIDEIPTSTQYVNTADTFTGDGTTTSFQLSYASAISITAVTVNESTVSSGYSLDTSTPGEAWVVFTTAPAAPVGIDEFTGDGSETTFELSATGATAIIQVKINDVVVATGFTLDTSTNSIVFSSAPANDADIHVTYSAPGLTDNIEVSYTIPDPGYDSNDVPTVDAVKSYVGDVQDDILARVAGPVLAPAYSDSQTYNLDEFCTYDVDGTGVKLYRCSTAVTSAEEFKPNKWTAMTIIDAIKYLIQNS